MLELNEEIVKALPKPERGNKVHYYVGAKLQGYIAPRGFGVRVTKAGQKSFILNYRLQGREYRYTIGAFPDWKPVAAVKFARDLRQRVDRGENIQADKAPPPVIEIKTVSMVLDDFVSRYLEGTPPLRSAPYYKMAFDNHVRPRIGKLDVYALKRSEIAKLLDEVEDSAGPVAADRTRAYLRKAMAWLSERDDAFTAFHTAFGRVKPRANGKDRARTRVLSDAEIKALWPCLAGAGTFGALVKTLLLTAQRRDEVANMVRTEIAEDGIWTIPAERYKTKRPNFVPLSRDALAAIEAQWVAVAPKPDEKAKELPDRPKLVFPSGAGTPFSAFSKGKRLLDEAVLTAMQDQAGLKAKVEPIPNWTLHDIRRTSKTLMMRAGVRPDISERVLGHVIAGVEGTYDRHSYADEKREALEKLAEIIEAILE